MNKITPSRIFKYVPKKCMSKELQEIGEKFYQYTAIDEYSRL